MQAQLQALVTGGGIRGEGAVVAGMDTEVARPQVFDRISSKISGFVTVCRLYIRMKMRKAVIEKQIQQVLLYVQRRSVDVWKENTLENLKRGLLEYETVGEFLADIKKEFGERDKKSVKIAELKKLE